jgi:ABC-2 type transport system ATP-binding protein
VHAGRHHPRGPPGRDFRHPHQQNNYKKVRVAAEGLSAAALELPGVTNVQIEDGLASFFFKGDINAVLHKLSSLRVSDATIEEPTLEEIFMHYYE